jgi:hypothetical protein
MFSLKASRLGVVQAVNRKPPRLNLNMHPSSPFRVPWDKTPVRSRIRSLNGPRKLECMVFLTEILLSRTIYEEKSDFGYLIWLRDFEQIRLTTMVHKTVHYGKTNRTLPHKHTNLAPWNFFNNNYFSTWYFVFTFIMKHACPADKFFYVINELKDYFLKKTEGGNFLKFQKEFLTNIYILFCRTRWAFFFNFAF